MSQDTVILSEAMQAFIASGVPKYGGEKPFTLSHDDMDFEASEWWNIDEYMTIGVVLTEFRNLFHAIMAMHAYLTDEWDKATQEVENKAPAFPAHEYEDEGEKHVLAEYYTVDSLRSFPFRMALIVPVPVGKQLKGYRLPYDLEVYMVIGDGSVFTRLPEPVVMEANE